MIDPTLYLTQVAWETLAKNIVMLSPWTYRVTVKYENVGNIGRGQQEVGFYFKDFLGETYLITAINVGGISGNIEITDSFKCGHGPVSDRTAIVYKSVGDGESPFLAPVMYQRLDKSAFDKSRAIELDILWKRKLIELLDCPVSYVDQALKSLRVNATEDGIEFADAVAGGYEWWKLHTGLKVKYGYMYNGFCALDINISAVGSHVPSDAEWTVLTNFLGGLDVAGGKLKESGFAHWDSPNTGATNETGFTAFASGTRNWYYETFDGINLFLLYWSTTPEYSSIRVRAMSNYDSKVVASTYYPNYCVNSIRLIVDSPIEIVGNTAIYVGNDLKRYKCVKIGTQWWMAENLAETKYRDGSLIDRIISTTLWKTLTTGAMCAFNYDEANAFEGGGEAILNSTDVLEIVAGENVNITLKNKILTISVTPVVEPSFAGLSLDMPFEFRDIVTGTAAEYDLDIKATNSYVIESAILQTDNGTLTGVKIKINTVQVSGLSNITVDTTVGETFSTEMKTVNLGDQVKLSIAITYTGTPTLIKGKLKITLL